jgi:hypothetical protein
MRKETKWVLNADQSTDDRDDDGNEVAENDQVDPMRGQAPRRRAPYEPTCSVSG